MCFFFFVDFSLYSVAFGSIAYSHVIIRRTIRTAFRISARPGGKIFLFPPVLREDVLQTKIIKTLFSFYIVSVNESEN